MKIPFLTRWARNRRQRFPEDDYFALDPIAGRILATYTDAVTNGEDRAELARVLTALAGCELMRAHGHEFAVRWKNRQDGDV